MIQRHPSPFRLIPVLAALLLAWPGVLAAQYELRNPALNPLFQGGIPEGGAGDPAVTTPQFSGAGVTNSATSSVSIEYGYPSAQYTDPASGLPTGEALVLGSSRLANPFAAGVPRYLLGDIVSRPATEADGLTEAAEGYWRRQPVSPGETFNHPEGPQDAGPPVPASRQPGVYYSLHAERVFATQVGQVGVTWVTRVPVAVPGDTRLRYRYREETFSVSSATQQPVRRIYWTERSFNGPIVNIPIGSIETVNPVYSPQFPAQVAEEYRPVGVSVNPDENSAPPPEKRTLWFEKTGGIGQLRAYNIEGRVFVEYLGALKPGSSVAHQFLGADIVEVVRVAPSINAVVDLGHTLEPRDEAGRRLPADGLAPDWLASPLTSLSPDAQSYYASTVRPDGRLVYHAERENDNPDRVVFYWLESADAGIHLLPAPSAPGLEIHWPVLKNNYILRWPATLDAYAHYTVGASGSTPGTGLLFPPGSLPEIVFQDDRRQTEASIDSLTQRLVVAFRDDALNRTLLKFTSGNEVWYVPLYIQAAGRPGFEESDGLAPLHASATVGARIDPPLGYEPVGHIAAGDAYHPGAYRDPFAQGAVAAAQGAIIPVNAAPGRDRLDIWWFKRVDPPGGDFQAFYVPAKIGRYTLSWPADPDRIVLASNAGGGDLPGWQAAGRLYVQNDRALPGFNPNEEHALILDNRVYALRDDLNVTDPGDPETYTSEPHALLSFVDPADGRPAMRVFRIHREWTPPDAAPVTFDYPVTAGHLLNGPMPLPLLPLPVAADGQVANVEIVNDSDPAGHGPAHYARFTHRDRKGYDWVYRGPHAEGSPSFGMRYRYLMREGFYVPGVSPQPAVGTLLPYLRPLVDGVPQGDPVSGQPLTINYRPVWPDTAPELRIAETLTLAKTGLPDVFSQTSAHVLYQQSIALDGEPSASVILHDPVREKTYTLGQPGGLQALPGSLLTTTYLGKTYFQNLPPHLQNRLYHDPLRGQAGTLVLLGRFHDVVAGEDYLDLNVLSAEDIATLRDLPAQTDADAPAWQAAITALASEVETFVPDPARPGAYIVGTSETVSADRLAAIAHPDTAVVNYALTATGSGAGWVTLLFGDGRAFTPEAEPVALQVIRVAPVLHSGDLRAQLSSNPLDEKVTLRHSGDFAARPQDYEFEWRHASPQDGRAPATYHYAITPRLGSVWRAAVAPAGLLPTEAEYAAGQDLPLPRTLSIYDGTAPADPALPGRVLRHAGPVGLPAVLPERLLLTAALAPETGFVLYVNGEAVLAHAAPAPFAGTNPSSGLVEGGLPLQFALPRDAFRPGDNTIELALYTTAQPGTPTGVDFQLHATAETDLVASPATPWLLPNGTHSSRIVVGGSPEAPLGNPLLVMGDNYFTMRYRPKDGAANVAGEGWSRWMEPVLVEGWIKRVLAAINPFNQRMRDLANNAVNTDVSMLTQAGSRWEGDIALNLENINDFGLIEIYETILNRGKTISIDAGYDAPAVNDALLLAAGYLHDLYTILGNEAYADAANPTISIDDADTVTEVNTSRFSFEGQAASLLEEELALLRGRDDFLSPGVAVAPAYNRLYWNYTRGIDSGEALYAVNYNIKEKAGSPAADGVVDAADAQRMFPQGHGDAYGHYLTALTGYYRLLRNPHFTWTPRSEAVTVLGQTVQVDYQDERKFAAAAANLARVSQQILALTHRQAYRDDPAAGWTHYRDGRLNSRTGVTRHWGLDEWSSRATQGALYHWVVGNALLPDIDADPDHQGIQVIDRTTVPELAELALSAETFQTTIDNANSRLNPLGLSPGAIAFDISPVELKAGRSHYEQIHDRALRAVLNARGSFDQAAKMTRLLRNQENQIDNTNDAIVDQERAYVRRLIDLYGTPYAGDIGPGRTYVQGYDGPDTVNWFVIDRATRLVDTTRPITIDTVAPLQIPSFSEAILKYLPPAFGEEPEDDKTAGVLVPRRVTLLQPGRFVQYSDTWFADPAAAGQRVVTGRIQQALLDVHQAHVALLGGDDRLRTRVALFQRRGELLAEQVRLHAEKLAAEDAARDEILRLRLLGTGFSAAAQAAAAGVSYLDSQANALSEFFPRMNGFSNDVTSGLRGAIKANASILGKILTVAQVGFTAAAGRMSTLQEQEAYDLQRDLSELGFSYEVAQAAYEYRLLHGEIAGHYFEIAQLVTDFQRATEALRNIIAEGDRLLAEREIFRQRSAALIQGYRTRDLTFRTFRNEALEQYRTLFDLAARYTYLSAKSYDYETGLLGTAEGRAVVSGIVASRSLGDLTGDTPQATVSTLGDSGLAGAMARLQADWSVAKGRLGINNPDPYGTLFSLRRELFRIRDDDATEADDIAWRQALEQHIVPNLLADADVAAAARNLRRPDGGNVPGIIIPFRSTIEHGLNFFALPLASGDHAFTPSSYATKIYSAGLVLRGYIGMDPYAIGRPDAGAPASGHPQALSATPYVYLIPTGVDYMRAPPLGDTGAIRSWNVRDQALPLPYNLGASAFSGTQFFDAAGTLAEQPWILRKHQAFRPVNDPAYFYTLSPEEFTNSRLVGRSAWNGGWKIVIPANTLLSDEQQGLDRFVQTVRDIELFLRTYSHSGN